jgi:hypothetical protein
MISSVSTTLVARHALEPTDRTSMFRLLQMHFDGVHFDQFSLDLEDKDWVLLIRKGEHLVGFTTLALYQHIFDLEPITVVYSGDTIVRPDVWNSTALPRGWISAVKSLTRQFSNCRCYWLLLTSGFRTYRFLPVFWRDFYPRYNAPLSIPPLLAELASKRFGRGYDQARGIVRFERPQRLTGDLKQIPAGRELDPHVAFFLARNPHWAKGEELVCLTELSDENLTAAGRRMTRANPNESTLCCR